MQPIRAAMLTRELRNSVWVCACEGPGSSVIVRQRRDTNLWGAHALPGLGDGAGGESQEMTR